MQIIDEVIISSKKSNKKTDNDLKSPKVLPMTKEKKNASIKASLKATKEKRKEQVAKVYEIKIDKSHLNTETKIHLNKLFLEAKWFYNYILSQHNIFEIDYKINNVIVKVKDKFETRTLCCLSSQMKQSILSRTVDNIKGLSSSKKSNKKTGRLKFKSEINSIPLKQYEKTYSMIDKSHVHIQGIKQKLKVVGLRQIPVDSDIANSTLIKKHGDYYLKVTTYQNKMYINKKSNDSVGIDFGILKQLTLSNGISIQYNISITKKLRKLHRKLDKQILHSKNWYKTQVKIQKEFDKLNNIKKDIKNKIVFYLKNNYDIVCYQDESLKAWQRIWGKKIMSTALGGIISTLATKVRTPVEIDKFYPSTKTCHECGNIQKIELNERTYTCRKCGSVIDRDLNSALCIEKEGLKKIGMVHTKLTPVEIRTSALKNITHLNNIPHIKASLVGETGSLCT